MTEQEPNVDVYPVGFLHDALFLARTVQRDRQGAHIMFAWRKLVRGFKTDWRRRSYWNGYLAEHSTAGTRAGHGWTHDRAMRDLAHHLFNEQPNTRQERP